MPQNGTRNDPAGEEQDYESTGPSDHVEQSLSGRQLNAAESSSSRQLITERSSPGRQLKRRRVNNGPQYARRKRAAIACGYCRQRKHKCDNIRPICGFCRIHQARCVYEGEDPAEKDIVHDASSQEIIDRLKEIRSLLQNRDVNSLPSEQSRYAIAGGNVATFSTSAASEGGIDDHFSSPSLSTCSALRCESLLRWPVFDSLVTDEERQITSFALEPVSNLEKDTRGVHIVRNAQQVGPEMSKGGRGVKDDDFVPLCRKFLIHVHPRNPILEADELIKHAREASEHGLSWDSASCLVLLACALACYTIPWETATRLSVTVSDVIIPADVSEEDKETAEAYYLAARKRIGLLGTSIQDIQCLFFASVFEKYSIRPVQAWFYIQQAATRLQAHLIGCGRQPKVDRYPTDKSGYHLEQRVFWSCVKAESELAPELGLQTSGLTGYAYPDQFPSPPKTLATRIESGTQADDESSQSQERGWFFYLAEISLRRTINDTLQLLYRHGERRWVESIDLLVAQHDEQQKQVLLWHSYLPSTIQFPDTELAKHELSFYLQGRFLEWRQYLHRPFLFYALHQPLNHATGPRIVQLAQEGIGICAETLPQCIHHHRHGGTWFVARSIWICAMLILAVVLRQGDVYPPPDWRSLVQMALQALRRWTHEAPDIHRMELILSRIFERVQSNLSIQDQEQ